MEQKTEASQAVEDLDALAKRLDRIHTACCDTRPKKAVGEMIYGMLNMSEWNRVRAALKAQPAPTEALCEQKPFAWAYRAVNSDNWHATTDKAWAHAIQNMERKPLYEHPAPTEAAQGEDSARLDWMESNVAEIYRLYNREEYQIKKDWKHIAYGKTVREAIDRARASAETGGVKP